jgi:hypothetical protein
MPPGRAFPSSAFAAVVGAAILCAATLAAAAEPAKQTAEIDLTQWPLRDIASVRDDPFGMLVKYGYTLFTDTANQIGPMAGDPAKRFAGNNLACGNCHLQGGSQPYAMPLVGIWGQFPQYRAREGAVDTLEDRINGCMKRSEHSARRRAMRRQKNFAPGICRRCRAQNVEHEIGTLRRFKLVIDAMPTDQQVSRPARSRDRKSPGTALLGEEDKPPPSMFIEMMK